MPDFQRVFPYYNAFNHQLQDRLFLLEVRGGQPALDLTAEGLHIRQHLLALHSFLRGPRVLLLLGPEHLAALRQGLAPLAQFR